MARFRRIEEDETASPGHKLGQIIGTVFERYLEPSLAGVVESLNADYYLDKKGPRPARGGKKITWKDGKGSLHDLDYVIEKGGTPNSIGRPVAFVEVAWRRYTKHSINKAGELIASLVPLKQTYSGSCRFIGAVVSGEWTAGALDRMRGQGIISAHFDYEVIRRAVLEQGEVSINYDESASEAEKRALLAKLEGLTDPQLDRIGRQIFAEEGKELAEFIEALKAAIECRIVEVIIAITFAASRAFTNPAEAIDFLRSVDADRTEAKFAALVVEVKRANGDTVSGRFSDKKKAEEFLIQNL